MTSNCIVLSVLFVVFFSGSLAGAQLRVDSFSNDLDTSFDLNRGDRPRVALFAARLDAPTRIEAFGFWGDAWEYATETVESVKDNVVDATGKVIEAGKNIVEQVKSRYDCCKETLAAIAANPGGFLEEQINAAIKAACDAWQGLKDFFKELRAEAEAFIRDPLGWWQEKKESLKNAIGEAWDSMQKFFDGFVECLADKRDQYADDAAQSAKTDLSNLSSGMFAGAADVGSLGLLDFSAALKEGGIGDQNSVEAQVGHVLGNVLGGALLCKVTLELATSKVAKHLAGRLIGEKRLARLIEQFQAFKAKAKKSVGLKISPAEQLIINKRNGRLFENAVAKALAPRSKYVLSQVVLEVPDGTIVRIDFIAKSRNGRLVLHEAKSSATAPLTPNQKVAFPQIEKYGAIVLEPAGPLPAGTQLSPARIRIQRPANTLK